MGIRINPTISLLLLLPVAGLAQRFGPTGLGPADFRGVFNPTVGAGAAYRLETSNKAPRAEEEIAILGSEMLDGKRAYWIEFAPLGESPHYIKMLVIVDGKELLTKRMITQSPGMPPVELPVPDTLRRAPFVTPADNRELADKVGTESITTPAGTFNCDHYRAKDGTWEEWLSPQVGPWGLVKTTSRIGTVTLTRIVTHATDRITGSR